jgi:hypothetical protein
MFKEIISGRGVELEGKFTFVFKDPVTGKVTDVRKQKNAITQSAKWANWCNQMDGVTTPLEITSQAAVVGNGIMASGAGAINARNLNTSRSRLFYSRFKRGEDTE